MIERIIQEGDKVSINISDHSWQDGYRPFPKQKGTLAEVIGFQEITYSRRNPFSIKPGVYTNPSWVKLILEDGREYVESTSRLELEDKNLYEERKNLLKGDMFYNPNQKFLRELPETEFWEGDRVVVKRMKKSDTVVEYNGLQLPAVDIKEVSEQYMIIGIQYDWREKNEPWTYAISDSLTSGYHSYAKETEIALVARGELWKQAHQ